jgi:hypothetical protein
MPPLLNLFGLILHFLVNNFPIVFLVLKEILRLEFWNNYVMNLVCFPTYINFTHLVCAVSVMYAFSFLVQLSLCTIAISSLLLYKKVKQSHYRSWQALRLPDFKTVSTWRWQACKPYAPAAFTHRKCSWYWFLLRGWVDPRAIVQLEGKYQWKFPMTPLGIDPATFQFVARCLLLCSICFILLFSFYFLVLLITG